MPKFHEDWIAVLFGGTLLLVSLLVVLATGGDADFLKPWLTTPGAWNASPLSAFGTRTIGIAGAAAVLAITFGAAARLADGTTMWRFLPAFGAVFLIALIAYLGEVQEAFNYWGLAYPLWAIVLGLLSGMQGRSWALPVNIGIQFVLILGAFIDVTIGIVGIIFLLVWLLILYLRSEVKRRQDRGLLPGQQ